MKKEKTNKALIGTSILLAVSSSLCCIMPILAIFGGIGGFASSLSWIEPLRPYLIIATILILGFAFYQAYRPQKVEDCCAVETAKGSNEVKKKGFMASKKFLWIITIVSVLLMSFPYYSGFFIPSAEKKVVAVNKENMRNKTFYIEGMSCKACENHVNNALFKQKGIIDASTDYEKGLTHFKYDYTKVSLKKLAIKIEKETGYKVKQ